MLEHIGQARTDISKRPQNGCESFQPVTEQLLAREPSIRVSQGSSPDRYRTNTKPSVQGYRHKGGNRSYSHSRRNREPLRALPRVVQGQHRDLSRDQLPTRHRDDHDVANLRHASRRSNYRRHASQRQRYARPHQRRAARRHRSSEAHRRASHPRSQYLHPHASRRHVRRHDGQQMTVQPKMPATQPPLSESRNIERCLSSEFHLRRTTRPRSQFRVEFSTSARDEAATINAAPPYSEPIVSR